MHQLRQDKFLLSENLLGNKSDFGSKWVSHKSILKCSLKILVALHQCKSLCHLQTSMSNIPSFSCCKYILQVQCASGTRTTARSGFTRYLPLPSACLSAHLLHFNERYCWKVCTPLSAALADSALQPWQTERSRVRCSDLPFWFELRVDANSTA